MLEFGNKIVGYGENEEEITEENIDDIMVTALEGGINYWAGIDISGEEWKSRGKNVFISSWATKILLEGGEICIYDIEEENQDEILTLKKLLEGIKLNKKCRPLDSNLEEMDATTADCIIQYALFGNVVYN